MYYELSEEQKIKIFNKAMDSALYNLGFNLKPNELFRYLNNYQNMQLHKIEESNNYNKDTELKLHTMFHGIIVLDKFNKTKSEKVKKSLIKNIVLCLVSEINSVDGVKYSGIIEEMYNICIDYKDNILANDWYSRFLPKGEWLYKHLKELAHDN